MTTQTKTLKQLCAKVKLELAPGTPSPEFPDPKAHHYIATLTYKGDSDHWPFHTGSGWKEPPTAADVMECLLSDADGAGQGFESWCADYGYDSDSKKAESIYYNCRETRSNLKFLLGEDFKEFLYAERS